VGLALRVLREVRARVARARGQGGLEARVAPAVAEILKKRMGAALSELESWMKGPLRLVPDASVPAGGWSIKGIPPRGAPPTPPVPGPAGVERP